MNTTPERQNGEARPIHPGVYANLQEGYTVHLKLNDRVLPIVRTGGSAQIPCFIEMMGRFFGPEKVVLSDVFSSVTAGLAIRACKDPAEHNLTKR